MKIVLIGSGNVACSLGQLFIRSGHQVLQVINRSPERGEKLAGLLNAAFSTSFAEADPTADLYLVALADRAIPELMLKWQHHHALVVHTAGTVPMAALQGVSGSIGVFYPLQSLKGTLPVSGTIPFLIQASGKKEEQVLTKLAESLNAPFQVVTDKQRLHMHVSAVWVNNFSNLMFSIAYRLCEEHKLSFDLLLPLIKETCMRLESGSGKGEMDPFNWQTGPAIREDQSTIRRHLELMSSHPDWKDLYEHLTEEIISYKVQIADGIPIQKAE